VEKKMFIISDDVPKEISEDVQREAELEVVDDEKL
jgi:ribosomal protein L30E